MKKHLFLISIAILVMMSLIGCPNDGQNTNSNDKITSLQAAIDNAKVGGEINLSKYNNITNYNATVNKALTINASNKNFGGANVTVTADGVVLNNVKNSNVTASASLGNGSLKIASSSLSTLTINGGGINSIELFGKMNVGTLIVNKETSANQTSENVRIQISNQTSFTKTTIASNVLFDAPTGYNPNDPNTPPLFKEDISFGDNAFNIAFRSNIDMTKPDNMAKATFETDLADKSFYIFVKEGNRLNKALVEQSAEKICGGLNNIVNRDSKIDINYDDTYSAGQEITYVGKTNTDYSFVTLQCSTPDSIAYVSDCSRDNTNTITTSIEQQLEILTYYNSNSQTVSVANDKSGNLYLTQDNNVYTINKKTFYWEATTISKNLDSCHTRCDVFDNKNELTKTLYVVTNTSIKENDGQTSNQSKITYWKIPNKITPNTDFPTQTIDLSTYISGKSFVQAIAVDNNNDLYIAICHYSIDEPKITEYSLGDVATNNNFTPAELKIDKNKSAIYHFKLINNNSLEEINSISYNKINGLYLDKIKISEYPQPYEDQDGNKKYVYTLEQITRSYSFGISDMRYVDGQLVICTENKTLTLLTTTDPVCEGKVIFYNPQTRKVTSTISSIKESDLYGPSRIAYCDNGNIVIYDEGFYYSGYNDDSKTNIYKDKSQLLGFNKSENNEWKMNIIPIKFTGDDSLNNFTKSWDNSEN